MHQVQLLRTLLESQLDQGDRPRFELITPALAPAARRTRARIRLLDRRGALLADSHQAGPPEGPEPEVSGWTGAARPEDQRRRSTDAGPLRQRSEIQAALRGELGTATRIYQRTGRVFLFVAMPVMVKRRVQGVVYATRSTTPVLLSLYRLRQNLLTVLAVALGSTALLTLFLAATISRPLGHLTRAARRIAAGDRSARLRLSRRDEIGQLARAFDEMVRQLDGRAQYIAELAANLSHEFKTPLAAIRGAAELLADGAAEDPVSRERFLQNILADTERLTRLVSRILELSRIEASLEHRERVELGELARAVTKRFPEGRITLELSGPLQLAVNPPHIESALCALLENALRYSPPDQPVQLQLWGEAQQLRLRVSDQGPGISPANQQKVFSRFFTTDAHRGGSGLGLAIAATVAQAHGGSISVTSSPGQGSTFELRLPRC